MGCPAFHIWRPFLGAPPAAVGQLIHPPHGLRARLFRREQIRNRDAKDFGQSLNLNVGDGGPPQFDVGQNIPGDIKSRQLELGNKLVLSPIPQVAEFDHIWPDKVGARTHTNACLPPQKCRGR